ncbi:MAG: hypothetical protein AAF809_03500 [Bacteroidota bacterium]
MRARLGLMLMALLIAGVLPVTAQPLHAWVGVGVGPGALPELAEREQNEAGLGALSGAFFASLERGPVVLTLRSAFATELYGDDAYDLGVLPESGAGD